jgi:hypothetical protein
MKLQLKTKINGEQDKHTQRIFAAPAAVMLRILCLKLAESLTLISVNGKIIVQKYAAVFAKKSPQNLKGLFKNLKDSGKSRRSLPAKLFSVHAKYQKLEI